MPQSSDLGFALRVNADRLQHSLAQLAEIGRCADGSISRIAFSPADQQARQQVQTWMLDAGMMVRLDAAGNLIGRYPGQVEFAPALATGSHIDTVPKGGRYDGCLGVLAGIEIVRVLQEHQWRLQHPLEVIVFTDEESTVIGSKAMAGQLRPDPDYYRRQDGTAIATCLASIGGDWSQIATARRDRRDLAAFVELHVEQGGLLEAEQIQIGIVKGVVGQYRLRVEIQGRANHAGTTPMHLRQDALLAAAQVILAVNRLVTQSAGEQVGTVGYLQVAPNASNTIASHVELRIDLRDLSQQHLDALRAQVEQELVAIAGATRTTIQMQEIFHVLPTLATPVIMSAISQVCHQQGLRTLHLPSRAGHDAQEIGRITDMGMIFVPSQQGISHSGAEYTSPQQCAQGADVLLQTLLQLDSLYPV